MFRVGDRVKYVGENGELINKFGTICNLETDHPPEYIGVRFDTRIKGNLSTCDGTCEEGYGYWAHIPNLRLIKGAHVKVR